MFLANNTLLKHILVLIVLLFYFGWSLRYWRCNVYGTIYVHRNILKDADSQSRKKTPFGNETLALNPSKTEDQQFGIT